LPTRRLEETAEVLGAFLVELQKKLLKVLLILSLNHELLGLQYFIESS